MAIKRYPQLTNREHYKRYEALSKADITEAFRDMFREFGGAGELDNVEWMNDLERRVNLLKKYRETQQLPLPIDSEIIEIPITKGHVTIIDAIDADLTSFNWRASQSQIGYPIYVIRYSPKGQQSTVDTIMHRVILSRMLNRDLAQVEYVDHINGNGLDNRRCNLRLCNNGQNNANKSRQRNNKSGYKGVSWNTSHKKWRAAIKKDKKTQFIGYFDDPRVAYEAYKVKAVELFGEFARLD